MFGTNIISFFKFVIFTHAADAEAFNIVPFGFEEDRPSLVCPTIMFLLMLKFIFKNKFFNEFNQSDNVKCILEFDQ